MTIINPPVPEVGEQDATEQRTVDYVASMYDAETVEQFRLTTGHFQDRLAQALNVAHPEIIERAGKANNRRFNSHITGFTISMPIEALRRIKASAPMGDFGSEDDKRQ